jgi:hypothetical protein
MKIVFVVLALNFGKQASYTSPASLGRILVGEENFG